MRAAHNFAKLTAVPLHRVFSFALPALALMLAPALARTPIAVPKPRPALPAPAAPAAASPAAPSTPPSLTDIPDISKAMPASEAAKLPSSEERYRTLQSKIDETKPNVENAKNQSEALKAETDALRLRLIQTASRVLSLEQEKSELDAAIAVLSARETVMAKSFARDRVAVAHLLGILERLQHDMPPVIALKAGDALGAAEGAMLLGASLPRVYGAAAALSRRLEALRRTRAQLLVRRAQSARNAVELAQARDQLDQLLATKQAEASIAASRYDALQDEFDKIAKEATGLGQLLQKVAALRAQKAGGGDIVVVSTGEQGRTKDFPAGGLKPGALTRPVVGPLAKGGMDGVGGADAPGVTFLTQSGAQVISPADSQVLFAGPYHKSGQVLILEMTGGYDLVLAGLDRVDVKVGDQLLAGEPLGTMPRTPKGVKLYFELRRNGKGTSPAPWLAIGLRKAERS